MLPLSLLLLGLAALPFGAVAAPPSGGQANCQYKHFFDHKIGDDRHAFVLYLTGWEASTHQADLFAKLKKDCGCVETDFGLLHERSCPEVSIIGGKLKPRDPGDLKCLQDSIVAVGGPDLEGFECKEQSDESIQGCPGGKKKLEEYSPYVSSNLLRLPKYPAGPSGPNRPPPPDYEHPPGYDSAS